VAVALHAAGAQVFATGRSIAHADLPAGIDRIPCDHADDSQVQRAFDRVLATSGRLDILVNNAWGGYEGMVEDGRFTWPAPFWEQPTWRWEAMVGLGARAAFVASQIAARAMIQTRRGLIANISFWSARKRIGNVIYGVAKAATDKLTHDMAEELRPYDVAVVSLYPGLVRTEAVLAAGVFDLSTSESPEFTGRGIAALAGDTNVLSRSGEVLVVASLAREYGFTDVDGKLPPVLTIQDL
jgi:NAD(P)-dependent dehydrogenase (short-subunit alcohol dehydrogenase family)